MSLRFNEINCNAQCRKCNWLGQGEDVKYTEALKKKYGDDIINKIEIAKHQTNKLSQFYVDEMVKYYTEKVNELKKSKI